MALRLIRCTGTSDSELDAGQQILQGRPRFERVGMNINAAADENDIAALEARGLIVEIMPETPGLSWLEPEKVEDSPETLAADQSPVESSLYVKALQASDGEYYVVQFNAMPTQTQLARLTALDIRLGAYVPDFAYKVKLTVAQKEALEEMPGVRRVVYFSPRLTLRRVPVLNAVRHVARTDLSRMIKAAVESTMLHGQGKPLAAPPPAEETEGLMFNIRCHERNDIRLVYELIRADSRIRRVEPGLNRLRIWTSPQDSSQVCADLARLPQVSAVEPYEYPTPLLRFACTVIGVTNGTGASLLPWDGKGQLVGVADSGVDTKHPDLKNQIAHLSERVTPEEPDDPFGHGTHVCSILAGDGTASGGVLKGIAPGAKLVVQSVRDRFGRFTGIPLDISDLFQEAYDRGVRIHNNSWGAAGAALYTTDAFELDQFVYDHPDFLIVVAAGNEGQQPNPLDPADPLGHIGFGSIASPATSKNSLTVGACCSTRLDGPYQGKPWRDYQGKLPSPQLPPLSNQPICGDADVLAAFSSRGPVDDARMKPDLVVPGTVLLAAKSAPSSDPADLTFGGRYTYKSGTSMAAPCAAGAAAIVRQYYVDERRHSPSAALLRATLINGSFWIKEPLAEDNRVGEPNFHQGFGRLDLLRTLPLPNAAKSVMKLSFVDIGRSDPDALTRDKPEHSTWKKNLQVVGGLPLRLTLCWTDYPAHGLQNHLDFVVRSPSSVKFFGNPSLNRPFFTKFDHSNNAQRIVVDNPEPGEWMVMVNAAAITFPSQGFSLVATGADLSDFY